MERIEVQMSKLEAIMLEQGQVVRALREVPEDGVKGGMIPLGAGVQLVVDMPPGGGAVIDIGNGIQAERTRIEAADALEERQNEVNSLLNRLHIEFDDAEKTVRELATKFNEAVERLGSNAAEALGNTQLPATSQQLTPTAPTPTEPEPVLSDLSDEEINESSNEESSESTPKRRRRGSGFGGELTLDD
jgi:prefoldin subunit 5